MNNLVTLLLLSCVAFFVSGEEISCTADFNIFTQPPNWPNGLNAQFSVQVDNSALVGGWVINFTAKGYGPKAPFNISSFWNSGSVSVQDNGDNTFSYSITNAAYNAQFPSYIGFNAETYLPHPRNAICGFSINNIPCSLSVSPAVLPPVVPSASILLNYEYYNAVSTNLPLLVLVHGITENMQSWDPLISLFTPYYRVLAVDLRGHGNSQNTPNKADYYFENLAADVYNTVVTVVGNNDLPLMVGHSLGGLVVTAYGSVFPVRGVICVDQSMDLSFFQGAIQAAEPALSGDNAVFLATISFLFSTMYGSLSQSEVARLDALRSPVQNVVLGVWAPLFDLTSAELSTLVDEAMQYPGGTAYLAIFGANPGAEYQNWLEERIPGAVSELWGELGHYPHLIYPSLFVQRVRDFDAAATQQLCI